jgi:hypothetical protein
MFGDQHKSHKIERTKTIYEQKLSIVNRELKQMKLRINGFEVFLNELQDKQEKLKKMKEEKIKELVLNYRTLNQKLEQELEQRISLINQEKQKT